jgi:7-cyano-7-deazaguanosine (preQ0) biosynthesis protein QueE
LSTDLFVNEIFGPTLQGEGPAIGQPAVFLRLAGCNLACVWCDTPYSWDWKRFDKTAEVHRMAPADVQAEVRAHKPPGAVRPLVVISGGEPMLQQRALAEFARGLGSFVIHVETAGTKEPDLDFDHYVTQYVVSPKLQHSGNSLADRYKPEALIALDHTDKVAWKFVVQDVDQLDEVEAFVTDNRLYGPVYIMPEGATPERLAETGPAIVEAVIARGWNFTPRLHIMLWGTKRGV